MKISQLLKSSDVCPVCGQTPCNCTHIAEAGPQAVDSTGKKVDFTSTRTELSPGDTVRTVQGGTVTKTPTGLVHTKNPTPGPRAVYDEGTEEQVGFHLDSERAYEAVMARFGDIIDHDEESGIMYVPARVWPKVEMVAYDADGIGAQRDDELENPEHYGIAEGEQQKGADYRDPLEADYGDDYQDMVSRVKKLAGLGPLKTVYDPNKRVYKNIPTAVQPKK